MRLSIVFCHLNPILTFKLRPNIVFKIQNPILTFKLGPIIVFWHSISYINIQIEPEYRILTFTILFCHSNWGRLWHINIHNAIMTFELAPNIVFWPSKSNFDIRTTAKNHILVLKILLWYPKLGRISYLYIQNPILTFEMRSNISFGHSKSYFDIPSEAEYRIWRPLSYFDIQTGAECRILTFKILFWHSKWDWISYFDILNLILTFKLSPNIVIWHSQSYFDIRIKVEYWILTFTILFWHSTRSQI